MNSLAKTEVVTIVQRDYGNGPIMACDVYGTPGIPATLIEIDLEMTGDISYLKAVKSQVMPFAHLCPNVIAWIDDMIAEAEQYEANNNDSYFVTVNFDNGDSTVWNLNDPMI